jgi:trans-2-enoyl-CoA reductase
MKLFGFGVSNVDYEADVDPQVVIGNLTDLTQPSPDAP